MLPLCTGVNRSKVLRYQKREEGKIWRIAIGVSFLAGGADG